MKRYSPLNEKRPIFLDREKKGILVCFVPSSFLFMILYLLDDLTL